MGIGFLDELPDESASAVLVPPEELSPDQRAFINAYLAVGTVNGAHKRSKIHKFYHYCWLRDNPTYQAVFAQAEQVVLDDDIAEIRKRGIEGWDEPLDYKGELTGASRKRYSDNLAMFYIKAKNHTFKDNHKGDTINVNIGNDAKIAFDFSGFRKLLDKP